MDPNSDEKPGTPAPEEGPVSSEDVPAAPPEPEFTPHVGRAYPERDYWRLGAGVFAALALILIVLASVTGLSERVVPMEDRYLEVLIPETEEGKRPFALDELANLIEDNRISVNGRMTNNSLEPVENVVAVITARETTGRFPETIEVPVEPQILEPGESGDFSVSVTLRQKPDNYSVRFKIEHGPFVPHDDHRGMSLEISPAP